MTTNILREIEHGALDITPFTPDDIGGNPASWLQQRAQPGMLLLAHTDKAVIWGRVVSNENTHVTIESSSPAQIPLNNQMLIMARLFDVEQEIFLWQVAEGRWRARRLHDGTGEPCDYFDEAQILWGTKKSDSTNGFVSLAEGEQGMHHAPPEELLAHDLVDHKARLKVRHYLQEDNGWRRVAFSRLVKPQTEEVSA